MVVTGLVVMVVSVNSLGREVRIRILGTSTVKVDILQVVRVVGQKVVQRVVFLGVAVVDQERWIETNTQGMRVMVTVVSWATADAVVRVLFFSKRTLHFRTVRIRRSSRSETHDDEVYHQLSIIWVRKLTGSLLSMVHPCRRISYQPIGTSIQ